MQRSNNWESVYFNRITHEAQWSVPMGVKDNISTDSEQSLNAPICNYVFLCVRNDVPVC